MKLAHSLIFFLFSSLLLQCEAKFSTPSSVVHNNKIEIQGISHEPWKTPAEKSSLAASVRLRGGACSDSDPALFVKIAVGVALETALMYAAILAGGKVSERIGFLPDFFGLPPTQWLSLVAVIFGSGFFGYVADGGLSAATMQVLDPNTVPGDPDWYANLAKPSWNPPGWLFPIMWLLVSKPTQLVAVSRILLKNADSSQTLLALYCAHLSLGDAWNKVFFELQCPGRGAAVITAFFGLLLASTYLFYTRDPTAGLFMLPTCGWVLVATALNWNIYLSNK